MNLANSARVLGLLIACSLSLNLVASPSLLVKNALLFTMRVGDEVPYTGYLLVGPDGRIAKVGKGSPPPETKADEVLDAMGKFVTPGFVSAHSHIWQSAFRGLAADQYVTGWVNVVYRQQAVHSTPEDFYWFTLHGSLDHLRHGITSAYNFTYGHRAGDFAIEQWRAQLASGLRFVHAYQRQREASETEVRAALETFLAAAKADFARPEFLRMSLSGGAQSAESVGLDARLMRDYRLSNQTHYLEAPIDKEGQRARFAHLITAGSLGPDLFFGHFIHTDDAMLKAVAAAGSGMSWNPLSNGRLASGIADIPKYLTLGLKVGMGVDGQASADLPDPFENMRMGLYIIRAKYESALVMQPIDVLRLHTMGSATVMGVADKIGSLEIGKFADFLVIDPGAGFDRAPIYDPVATLVFACNTQNLEAVYVGGHCVMRAGKTLDHDTSAVATQVARRVGRIRAFVTKTE